MKFEKVQDFLTRLVSSQREKFFPRSADHYATVEELLEKLMSTSGEVSAIVTARELLNRYRKFSAEEKLKFFSNLEQNFNADPEPVRKAFKAYDEKPGSLQLSQLSHAVESRRQALLGRLNQTPGATADLIAMRNDLLELLPQQPQLRSVDTDFLKVFKSWFGRAFLLLERIDWSTPADVLEHIIQYEAVHEIRDWTDLRQRIEPENRRCFAFFHPTLEKEPLIFVEVALSQSVPASIEEILQGKDGNGGMEYEVATFYGISNCQPGLRNVSFGNFLIKQVVQELKSEFPSIKTFITLSPIPGFADWLVNAPPSGNAQQDESLESARQIANSREAAQSQKELLTRLAANYLSGAKTGRYPLDPVARFHLGNGAQIFQMHGAADLSNKGLESSRGVMVNYLYDLRYIERNHEAYMTEGVVDSSPAIKKLLFK